MLGDITHEQGAAVRVGVGDGKGKTTMNLPETLLAVVYVARPKTAARKTGINRVTHLVSDRRARTELISSPTLEAWDVVFVAAQSEYGGITSAFNVVGGASEERGRGRGVYSLAQELVHRRGNRG